MSFSHSPDWSFWLTVPALLLKEATALTLGIDPPSMEPHGPGVAVWSPPPTEFWDRLELARRAVVANQLAAMQKDGKDYVTAMGFATWAIQRGWQMPPEMEQLAEEQALSASAKRAHSTAAAATKCRKWLIAQMRQGPPAKMRDEYKAEAIDLFPGLSGRGFLLAWDNAKTQVGDATWSRPGPKSKRQIDPPINS